LSRGISRYQYFLGKWHARLAAVLGTFLTMGLLVLAAGYFLLHEDLSLPGSLVALATIAAVLGAVVSCGVTVSAVSPSTLLGIASLWVAWRGGGLVVPLRRGRGPLRDRRLIILPNILRGYYGGRPPARLIGGAVAVSFLSAVVAPPPFARRDV